MQLTRTLCGPNSTARLRASWKSAALEMLYTPMVGEPRRPPIDDTMMIEPSLRSIICGATIWISQWLEMTLLSSTLRN
ncbi:hypothetical protein D3C81_1421640 [compost metagenome]